MRANDELIQHGLRLLQQWGWDTGYEKLKAEIESESDKETRAQRRVFVARMATERGKHREAWEQLHTLSEDEDYHGWSLAVQAFLALREYDVARAHQLLDEATSRGSREDRELQATIDHCRGAALNHENKVHDALKMLCSAYSGYGPDNFSAGRVLDTLGMIYTAKDNFNAACELYRASLSVKERFRDNAGLALTFGNLGRLYLDWGFLDRAEKYLVRDLRVASRMEDWRGKLRMYNDLGRVWLEREDWRKADDLLRTCCDESHKRGLTLTEAFARKDRALALLKMNRLEEAEQDIRVAERIFREMAQPEGAAFVNLNWGILCRCQGDFEEARRKFYASLEYFLENENWAQAARAQLEIVRNLRAQEIATSVCGYAVAEALRLAELSRRPRVIEETQREFQQIDPVEFQRTLFRRVRGRWVHEAPISLQHGDHEAATVLFLDLLGSVELGRQTDPEVVMLDLNQMFAEFADVLQRHEATVSGYRGDGFMAILRGRNDAHRAVDAALEMFNKVDEFNLPRLILNRNPLRIRIGIDTGEIYIGNVGTYDKMDFSAIGTTANRASRIESEAEPGIPSVSESTFQLIRDDFDFRDSNPREIDAKGFTQKVKVWDVIGRKTRHD